MWGFTFYVVENREFYFLILQSSCILSVLLNMRFPNYHFTRFHTVGDEMCIFTWLNIGCITCSYSFTLQKWKRTVYNILQLYLTVFQLSALCHFFPCSVISLVQRFINEDKLPHLLFYGPPGTGKTSTILACAKQLYKDKEFNSMVLEVQDRSS